MFHYFNNIKTITLAITLLMASTIFAQKNKTTLPKTIIFKIKEQYRNKCTTKQVNIVKFNALMAQIKVNKLFKVFPNKIKEDKKGNVDLSLIYELSYFNNFTVNELIFKLKNLKLTEYIEPYYLPKLCYTPNDTLILQQYYLNLINAFNAWNINKGDSNIVVGITDTGWEPTHPDLIANVKINYADPINNIDDDNDGYIDNYLGWDLGMNDNNALWESLSHGVHVTGLVAAVTNNTTGVAGIGFKTKFLPIKISNATGILTQAYQGIVYAADHGCFIINCSWGGYNYSQFNKDIINYATINKGCLIVAAAGNDNGENLFYPAAYNGVLSVAATNQSDIKTSTSNYGTYINIAAPGDAILSTASNGSYGLKSGTSMAAPIVAGGAALVKAQFPTYTNKQVAAVLKATTDNLNTLNPTYVDKLGTGRLNLFNALSDTNAQFIEMTSKNISDNNNNIFEFGDTLRITGKFTNYLKPISGITVTLSSTSIYINIINGTTTLPTLNTLDTTSNYANKFLINILNGAPLNTPILIKAKLSNGSYSHNQYFTITLNPDYINVAVNQISTTITSKGKIGYNDANNLTGLGFSYKGKQLLYEAGLMIGDSPTRVADAVRGVTSPDQDFSAIQNVFFNPPYKSALDLKGMMNDAPLSVPMNINVTHFSYAYPTTPNDKFIIIVYDIENTGLTPLSNMYAGIFADWDIDNANLNKAGFDVTRKMGFVHSLNSDTIYAGIKLLTQQNVNNYALDLDGSAGVDANGGGFTTAEKYTTLSTSKNTAGGITGGDVADVVSAGSFNLNAGQHERIAFAIIAGDSLADIQASAATAQVRYNSDALNVNKLSINNDITIYPNPSRGIIYINSANKIRTIKFRNMLGETLQISTSNKINITKFPDGIYFVEVMTDNAKKIQKIVLLK